MKRILALAFAAGMIVALAPTDADAQRRGGGGMGGGSFAGGMGGGGMGGGFPGGMGGGGNWAGGMGGMGGGNWAGGGGRHWHGGNWRPGWGAAAAGAAALGAATYPWGYGYDNYGGAYASETDPCLQQRTVIRSGAYRTVWVNVC
jgi:hypothetical protein